MRDTASGVDLPVFGPHLSLPPLCHWPWRGGQDVYFRKIHAFFFRKEVMVKRIPSYGHCVDNAPCAPLAGVATGMLAKLLVVWPLAAAMCVCVCGCPAKLWGGVDTTQPVL